VAGITSVSGGILAGLITSGGILVTAISSNVGQGGVDNWYGVIAGIGVILTVIFNPEGIVGPIHLALEQQRARGMATRPGASFVTTPRPTRETHIARPAREAHVSMTRSAPPVPDLGAGAGAGVGAGGGGLVGGDDVALAVSDATVGANGHRPPVEGPLLEVRDLSVRYGGVVAVDQVTFAVEAGQIVGLIGPNGAGKTTTIDALCGFHPYSGSVVLDGRAIDGLSPHRRAGLGLARTFQLAGVSDDLTVEENVQVGQHRATRGGPAALARVLDELGLGEMRDLQVSLLSQGQRQLVSIARALAGEPRVLLLDEPAAGLDSRESQWLADRLRDVRATGVTIVLVDHDMSLVLNLCDTITVLDFGALIAAGPPEQIRTDDKVSTAYLGATHQRLVAT
jgi:ABC-type branched-subunit amino acid transport system ATPase component